LGGDELESLGRDFFEAGEWGVAVEGVDHDLFGLDELKCMDPGLDLVGCGVGEGGGTGGTFEEDGLDDGFMGEGFELGEEGGEVKVR
jgi:hypothetical protein